MSAQCPDLVTLSTQGQIDNFQANNNQCFEYDGHLIVKGTGITNLNGLSFLNSMTGTLEIIETSIISIESLSNISTINGSILISENNALQSLAGLEHIVSLDSLVLHDNGLIDDLDGLNNLESLKFFQVNNMNLSSFSGLESLENVSTIRVLNNPQIKSFEGLTRLEEADEIEITSNSAFESVEGLESLVPDATRIKISYSPLLQNFEGFEDFEELHILELEFNAGLVSMDGLENLEKIERLNIFSCNNLADLAGLNKLKEITNDLSFRLCGLIDDFSQLESLETIGRNLFLSQLISLVHLDDFNDVNIGNEIYIGENANLVDVTGFANLKETAGDLTFNALDELISIAGFLDMIGNGGLVISRTEKLKNLTGLANLQFVNGKLEIFENEALENLDDLLSLTYVDGIADDDPDSEKDVQIENNPSLTSIQGLNDLLYADDKIFIRNNPALTICDVKSICRFINDPNIEITIENNGFPCNSPSQIRSDCNSEVSDTQYNSCQLVSTLEISEDEGNTNGLINIFDDDGKIVCAINANGNVLGKTDFYLFVSSTDRYDDFNRPYLRRNISIVSEVEPETELSIRIFFKNIEIQRLQTLDPGIQGIEDLKITSIDSICAASFAGNPIETVSSTSQGNYLSDIDFYVEADFNELGNYFIHGPNALAIDEDGDGYDSSLDCDDSNAAINPAATEILDNDIDEDCNGILGITDLDGDGFGINEDCDDSNVNIFPGAVEIYDNEIDEDCDGIANVSDADGDGFLIGEDCDDNDPNINPNATEIIDNDIDENCDGIIEITDLDGDGFGIAVDCDDLNAAINPGAEEIPDNNIDENCDDILGVTDFDMDGFGIEEDCDDNNVNINPDAEEIPDNGIDDNCDGIFGITDLDMDGFGIEEDCDDEDPNINPDAEEILDNGIDDDCDGTIDEMTDPVVDLGGLTVEVHPNPAYEYFTVSTNSNTHLDVQLIDIHGRILLTKSIVNQENINVDFLPEGTYFLKMSNQANTASTLLFISR